MKEATYKKIYEENYPKVFRLCLGYTGGDEPFSKDLAQETFLKIWQHLDSFRNESAIETWIYRIAVNTCLAALRKEKKKNGTMQIENLQLSDEISNSENKEIMLAQLYACIKKLTVSNKAIILLELEGLPQQEIATIMGLKHEAVRTRIHRIKNQLTKCVHHE